MECVDIVEGIHGFMVSWHKTPPPNQCKVSQYVVDSYNVHRGSITFLVPMGVVQGPIGSQLDHLLTSQFLRKVVLSVH